MSGDSSLIRVAPFYYIHVLDNNSNTQRVEVGPQTFTRQDHEKVVVGPNKMIVVPPRHYCVIQDPYIRKDEKTKEPETDEYSQIKLRHGDQEIRFSADWVDPFPLLPGEKMTGKVTEMQIVKPDRALRLVAKRDFETAEGQKRVAGDEWLFVGPGTYIPRIEVDVAQTIPATIIGENCALKLQARKAFTDRAGVARKAGEEWLVRESGAYLPEVDVTVLGVVRSKFLLQTRALHLRATDTFTDVYGKSRKAGEEWLVTLAESETHLQDVYEEVVGEVHTTVLTGQQWCIVLDPVDAQGKNQYGARELRKGECSFFLLPGERLEPPGIQQVYVLGMEEALLLTANESFVDQHSEEGKEAPRAPGDVWMIHGPCDYIPPVEVQVVEKRQSIPLDETEGIYVRDTKSGKVRSVSGQTYMLASHEELWEKSLSSEVEDLLNWTYFADADGPSKKRDKTRVVTYRVPHNAAVQIYDYKAKKSRCVFGPGMVMLDPDEQFTVLSLSGDKPKRPNVIKTLALMLGPDFMTDIVEVETSDHARLRLQLSYNWHFLIKREGAASEAEVQQGAADIFQVRDFVGDACKAIASRVRGAVASTPFDQFHKNSARIIRQAVFGSDESGKINSNITFSANHLVFTNIDIQSVEPVDERTRESLMKSVQLAIEITTKKQERNARHDAEGIEQNAKGMIERQRIDNQKGVEQQNKELIELQSSSKAIETTGAVKAEASARAICLEIKGDVEVKQAALAAEASNIEALASLEETKLTQELEIAHSTKLSALSIHKAQRLAQVESTKFEALVTSISPETIKAIARAGPEMQAKLLKGLGLKGYLMTDGNSPINLFNAAKGMVGPESGVSAN